MFQRQRKLQYTAKPDKPDPIFAKMLQEPLGGQWGEISVMMTYLFQGWLCRGPQKYRDMILDIATEEIGHVEMLATMTARLLESSPVEAQEEMAKNSLVGAMMGGARIEDALVAGMNPQHLIVAGSGPRMADSVGNPWNAGYTIASGNLLADFRFNVTAESQGRLQVCRLYNMTEDAGVRDMLSFLIARDTMHQNQWLAAIKEMEEEGLDETPVPANFPNHWRKAKSPISSSTHRKAPKASMAAGREGHQSTARASSPTRGSRLLPRTKVCVVKSIHAAMERRRIRCRRKRPSNRICLLLIWPSCRFGVLVPFSPERGTNRADRSGRPYYRWAGQERTPR